MQRFRGLLAGLALVAGAVLVGWRWHPGGGGFAVVELYTSEGCSSCPPAEALLARTQQEDKGLPVYCLAFHVDYWDRQGWKDVFSDPAYTERQRQYAAWLKSSELYTPQAVVNGSTEFVGSDKTAMDKAIRAGLGQQEEVRLVLSGLVLNGRRLDWQYRIEGKARHLNLVAVVVEKNAVTAVKGGENTGRTLSEAQVVRSLEVQTPGAGGAGSGHIDWPAGVSGAEGELIAFLQDMDTGRIVAATKAGL